MELRFFKFPSQCVMSSFRLGAFGRRLRPVGLSRVDDGTGRGFFIAASVAVVARVLGALLVTNNLGRRANNDHGTDKNELFLSLHSTNLKCLVTSSRNDGTSMNLHPNFAEDYQVATVLAGFDLCLRSKNVSKKKRGTF